MAAAGEPQALFNGKDFEGWTFDVLDPELKPEAVWSVSDGILICKGRPPGVIRTVKEYSNYELLVEWRWAPDAKPGNSGVLIHASKPREMFAWPKSIEVQLAHENAGDFWTIGETLTVANRNSPTAFPPTTPSRASSKPLSRPFSPPASPPTSASSASR